MFRTLSRATALAVGASLLLSACGGGGGSSTPPAPTVLTVTGMAASGSKIANAAITAKCATGTGTATTGADGSYSLSITGGVLPCVFELTGIAAGGVHTTLHVVATSNVANISPLTELLIAQVTGAAPSALMSSTNVATLAGTFSAANVQAAQSHLLTLMHDSGIDITSMTGVDFVTGTLNPAVSGGYDGFLDNLELALEEGGSDIATFTTAVAAQSAAGSTGGTATGDTLSALAPELLLRPAHPNCLALREGSFWVISSGDASGTAIDQATFNVNASTLTLARDGTAIPLTANGTCRFSYPNGGDLVVAQSGIVVARAPSDDGVHFRLVVAIPKQTHTLAEAAGDWDTILSDTGDTPGTWVFGYGQQTVTSTTGGATVQLDKGCEYEIGSTTSVCLSAPGPVRTLTAESDGSFVEHSAATGDGGPWSDKMFVYRAGNGGWFLMAANLTTPDSSGDGSIAFGTRSSTLTLPAVDGTVTTNWNVYLDTDTQWSTLAIDANTHSVQSVNTTANTYVRVNGPVDGATHLETLDLNSPWDGFILREGALGVATSAGGTTNVRKMHLLRAIGTGVSVALQPVMPGVSSPERLLVAVQQPASD